MSEPSPPRGVENNNPCNLINASIPWHGLATVQPDPTFCTFVDARWGIRAAAKNLLTYYHREIDTIRAIISVWAPPGPNDTAAYIDHVSGWMDVPPDEVLDLEEANCLATLVEAIIREECGEQPDGEPWYESDLVDEAVNAALGIIEPGWPLAA